MVDNFPYLCLEDISRIVMYIWKPIIENKILSLGNAVVSITNHDSISFVCFECVIALLLDSFAMMLMARISAPALCVAVPIPVI
jgi:hypothetical protein